MEELGTEDLHTGRIGDERLHVLEVEFVEFLAVDVGGDLPGHLPVHQAEKLEFGGDFGQVALHPRLVDQRRAVGELGALGELDRLLECLGDHAEEQIVSAHG